MTWTSDEETTTQIEYGTTVSYGALSALNEDLTNTHHLVLTGLGPNTTYHYRVKVTNLAETEYLSSDYTFTTLV
jgi:phosphodiesterase/alkaline phosphatase D-like protein